MKRLIPVLITYFVTASCDKDGPVVASNCDLTPDCGRCFAYMPRYYFDKNEQRCKEFIWGGCGGVVPFETMEACKGCEGSSTE